MSSSDISRSRHSSTSNYSKMVQNSYTYNGRLKDGAILSNLEWSVTEIVSSARHYSALNIWQTVRIDIHYTNRNIHVTPYWTVLFRMTMNDLEWLRKISIDMERRAASLRQLSFLFTEWLSVIWVLIDVAWCESLRYQTNLLREVVGGSRSLYIQNSVDVRPESCRHGVQASVYASLKTTISPRSESLSSKLSTRDIRRCQRHTMDLGWRVAAGRRTQGMPHLVHINARLDTSPLWTNMQHDIWELSILCRVAWL